VHGATPRNPISKIAAECQAQLVLTESESVPVFNQAQSCGGGPGASEPSEHTYTHTHTNTHTHDLTHDLTRSTHTRAPDAPDASDASFCMTEEEIAKCDGWVRAIMRAREAHVEHDGEADVPLWTGVQRLPRREGLPAWGSLTVREREMLYYTLAVDTEYDYAGDLVDEGGLSYQWYV